MKNIFLYSFILIVFITLSACSKNKEVSEDNTIVDLNINDNNESEDRIVTDLNEIFDPDYKGGTDWNYTEIDEDWLTEAGLYYDYSIGAFRQKKTLRQQAYEDKAKLEREAIIEQEKKLENYKNKSMNLIISTITIIAIIYILFVLLLLYATYKEASNKHRIIGIWLFNCLVGGIWSFVILSLSRELKHDEDLDFREEPDLLGITIAAGNIMTLATLYFLIKLYFNIIANPKILTDLFG